MKGKDDAQLLSTSQNRRRHSEGAEDELSAGLRKFQHEHKEAANPRKQRLRPAKRSKERPHLRSAQNKKCEDDLQPKARTDDPPVNLTSAGGERKAMASRTVRPRTPRMRSTKSINIGRWRPHN